jgi:hypothetical protein
MTLTIELPDDRYLELGLHDTVDDDADVVAIEDEDEPGPENEPTEDASSGGRRLTRLLAVGALALATVAVARRRRRGGDGAEAPDSSRETEVTVEN